MSIKTACVITTIFPPSDAVQQFAANPALEVVVVGDRKTPEVWTCPGAMFLSAANQHELGFGLEPRLPWNHYCRKMLGYLFALREGAEFIYETDDDNLPLANWFVPRAEGAFGTVSTSERFFNVYAYYTEQHIWPRGYPLREISRPQPVMINGPDQVISRVGIWQGLANGDTDVDAIYRLTSDAPCEFAVRGPLVLPVGVICPFNSQNTFFQREFAALMYLPTTVTFRFTDILRGLVAQPILWSAGARLGFTDATVVQARNPHDYMKDFAQEVPMYLQTEEVVATALAVVNAKRSIHENLTDVYAALVERHMVAPEEMNTLNAWLADIDAIW